MRELTRTMAWLGVTFLCACGSDRPASPSDDGAGDAGPDGSSVEPDLDASAAPDSAELADAGDGEVEDGPPALHLFYAIHTHVEGDWVPYSAPGLRPVEEQTPEFGQKAENLIDAIERIAEVLDRYGALGTWEVVFGTAQGLCRYMGGPESNVFRELVARGHEVGVHAHRSQDLERADAALRDECGIDAITSSGFLAMTDEGAGGPQAAVAAALAISQGLGHTVGTENLAPGGGLEPVGDLCPEGAGVGNDMFAETRNLMFPWRPDVDGQDVCAHDPSGPILAVDHVTIGWMNLQGEGKPDILAPRHFDHLRGYLDGALAYMERERPERTAAWGFVTHLTEYTEADDASHPADPSAIDALDELFAYVDAKREQGRIVYSTAAGIAALPDE